MQKLQTALASASKNLFNVGIEPELTRPDEQFGDYATNIALKLASKLDKNPKEIAEQLAEHIKQLPSVAEASVAGAGFLNIKLSDSYLSGLISKSDANFGKNSSLHGQVIVLEHTDPNPFKDFHIGHAYSNTIGVAIGKLLENAGAEVHQVSYHGDVGLHIAMAIFGLKNPENQDNLGLSYAAGAAAYSDDVAAKEEIDRINTHLYSREDGEINQLYEEGRQRSLAAFEKVYQKLNSRFEKNYFESDTAKEGIEIVKQNIGKIFRESDGAIIYDGEKAGLHKRVFITRQGLPTYEAKEIGLAFAKARDYPGAGSFIVITANEIDDYFKVLVAAIKDIDEKLGSKIRHVSHGVVKFPEGKMSSRTGNVKLFSELESDIEQKIKALYGEEKVNPVVVLGSIKYEFLKHRIGSDFVFDVDESVSLQGDSGPYLQYAHARARSIVAKASSSAELTDRVEFDEKERSLVRKISEYPEVVDKATQELMPHHITSYLYELAQNFNRFYEKNRVIGSDRETIRLQLVDSYSNVLKNGLRLLNIEAPEHV